MSLNYIGSKHSLLNFLEKSIVKVVGKDNNKIFCDLFAGTGSVGKHFKKMGYKIIANDIQYYSYIVNKHYIENHLPLTFKKLSAELKDLKTIKKEDRIQYICGYLNNIKRTKGFIYKNYSMEGTKNKKIQRNYFTTENSMKCDAIRKEIEKWFINKTINESEYHFLLTSLLESVDKHANTACVYGAFLKKIKTIAQKTFSFIPAPLIVNKKEHVIFNENINDLMPKIKGDILYLDPPYNHRQYATNYHILETISRYDNPKIKGVSGLREYENEKSLYCSKVNVCDVFEDLIMKANVKYIFLSYNNEGIMELKDIKRIMSKRGKYGVFTKKYKRYKADSNRMNKADTTVEYLHYVVCKQKIVSRSS